ncbi:MAG TPA: FAD-binding oxidoreductase [Xanthobacteraceae bacterium]|nr:FAD-binding oxidoreductase [Xanthobacteraceae bacterium]
MNVRTKPAARQETLKSATIERFAKIVGDKYAIRDPREMARFLHEPRDLYEGRAAMVLKPASTEEVSAILKLAEETKTPVVPQGGNTGLVGGQISFDAGAVVLSTARLDRIREVDAAGNSMICEAGVVLARAQETAAKHERLFPLSLGAEGSCTIGGNLATNAGGTQALSYGVARDLVLGLEVVLAGGRVWHGLRKLKKDNTGYDLRHLFIGSEGTLGIITAAALKLFPAPRATETAFIGLASPNDALALLNFMQARFGASLTSFELIAQRGIEFVTKHLAGSRAPLASPHPWYVLLEISSPRAEGVHAALETALTEAIASKIAADAVIAASEAQRAAFWRIRTGLTEMQKPEGGSIKHDVSVPVASVPAFIEEADAAVEKLIPGARPVPFGHLGDGNIHYNVSQPAGADREAFLNRWEEVNQVVHAIVARLGGSISAEHGIGVLKRELLPGVKDPVELELMRALKRALDPSGILNPGKVL